MNATTPKTSSGSGASSRRLERRKSRLRAEEHEDDSDLQWEQDLVDDAPGMRWLCSSSTEHGSGFEEEAAFAGFGAHVGEELFIAAELVDQAAVDLGLHAEDVGPNGDFRRTCGSAIAVQRRR